MDFVPKMSYHLDQFTALGDKRILVAELNASLQWLLPTPAPK